MMSDSLNQKISQYLDNDLNSEGSLQLLRAMQEQPEHQATLQRYLLIKQALKTRPVPMAGADFCGQLHAKLAQEPVHLLPQKRRKTYALQKTVLALAASFLAIAVLAPVVKKMGAERPLPALAVSGQPLAYQGNALKGGMMSPGVTQQTRLYPVNKRFQDYLQAHDGSLYTNGAATFQNRAQLASYGRGE